AEAGEPKPGTFLLDEDHHRNRPLGGEPPVPEQVYRGEAGHHPQRPIERSPVRDRVKVAARDDSTLCRTTQPGPDIAISVYNDIQATQTCLLDEPSATLPIDRSPGMASVTTVRSSN